MPQSAASPAWTLVPQAAAAHDWAAHLPRLDGSTVAARAARQRLAGRLRAAFPDERLGQIAASLEPWWPLRPRRTHGLELVLVHGDGRREKAVLFHRVVRIGRDASCQLQLQADTVSGQHCEIRVDEDRMWLVDLASSNGTRVNGVDLVAFEPRPLVSGDQIHVRPFRVVVGPSDVQHVPSRVGVSLAGPLSASGPAPFATLAGPHSLWVRVQSGDAAGFMRLPHGWLRSAYRALGLEGPAPPGPGADANDADLSLTAFLLQQVAAEAAQRMGQPVSLSAILPPHRLAGLGEPSAEHWEGGRFAVQIDEERFEVEALWPAEGEATAAAASEPELPAWLLALPYPVAVCAGFLRLSAQELRQVDRGDILLPDRWLPAGWAAQASSELGEVLLAMQGWSAAGELRFEKGYYHLQLSSTWTKGAKGASMGDRAEGLPEGMEGAPVRLPDELETMVSFELERIAVPLQELLTWQPGATVRLQRAPEDPLRIVLRQAGQERLLGYGRVVVVDEKIGIQIERWLVERKG